MNDAHRSSESIGCPPSQQRIQSLDDHARYCVAMFIGIFLRSFEQPTWNIDDNGFGIIITFARFRFCGHVGSFLLHINMGMIPNERETNSAILF